MAAFLGRPSSASTVTTTWSQHTSVSIGHNVPHRHIPVIKGDINFVHTTESNDTNDSVPSHYIKEILERLSNLSMDSIDHEDALEFLYDLFYMHSPYNQDDSRIGRLLIENDYCSIVHNCLTEFMNKGIFSSTSTRRSTQFILYTLWNFSGISIEFRLYLANKKNFLDFLFKNFLDYIKTLRTQACPTEILNNLNQAIISILHNITLNQNNSSRLRLNSSTSSASDIRTTTTTNTNDMIYNRSNPPLSTISDHDDDYYTSSYSSEN